MHMYSVSATDEFGSTYHQIRQARGFASATSDFVNMLTFDGTELVEVRTVNIDSVRVGPLMPPSVANWYYLYAATAGTHLEA